METSGVQRQKSYLRARPCSWGTNWTSRKSRSRWSVTTIPDTWLPPPFWRDRIRLISVAS